MMTTQTKNGVTFYVFQIVKSIDFDWQSDQFSFLGDPIPIVRHRGKLLTVRTCLTCSNDYLDVKKIRASIMVKDPERYTSYKRMDGCAHVKDGVYYDTHLCFYSGSTEVVDITCHVTSCRESDCEIISFENIPLGAKGIKRSASDCDVTLTGINEFFSEDQRDHWVEIELSLPAEQKHLGVREYTDNLGNQDIIRGDGYRGDRGQMFQIYKLHPDALSISFNYLISRRELSFRLENIPVP